ncbi:hypothetical protein CSKR_200210 [Clonorchis sinensis]|uniref:Uncharacterized protein n=1 Tax=Clonorchis sinensis TaxID=79923 RepID=A0A8T1LYU1_CLOSI|nr:hypothetical protein CSKR_200210 [Clonorchis sinensis]
MSIMATIQPVINWNNFAAYLVRAAQTPIICVGKKLEHLRDDLYMIPREKKDCATLMRDERGTRQKMANITRKRRLDLLRNLVETYDARSFNELNLALTYDERDDIYGEYGPQWKETAEHCIQNYTMRILVEQQTSRFEDHIRTNSHNRDCQHPRVPWMENIASGIGDHAILRHLRLPYQLFEFWTLNKDGNNFRDPLANLVPVYDYIHYNHASIRLSHFVPLQQSLSSTTQQDTPALNTTPYAYVAKDSLGILDSVTSPTAIDKNVFVNQQLKLPSNTYWAKESDEGLIGLANVKNFPPRRNTTLQLRI